MRVIRVVCNVVIGVVAVKSGKKTIINFGGGREVRIKGQVLISVAKPAGKFNRYLK